MAETTRNTPRRPNRSPESPGNLRRRAEAAWQAKHPELAHTDPGTDAGRVLHELEVHQIELELQNEELRRSLSELETAHFRPTIHTSAFPGLQPLAGF